MPTAPAKKNSIKKNSLSHPLWIDFLLTTLLVLFVGLSAFFFFTSKDLKTYVSSLQKKNVSLLGVQSQLDKKLIAVQTELEKFKNEDQRVRNNTLQAEINNIQKTYQKSVTVYEKLLDLKVVSKKTDKFDDLLAEALTDLSQRNYASADAILSSLSALIQKEKDTIIASFKIPENVPQANTPPASGYRRQTVAVDGTNYLVDIVSADLNSTRVIVDTANDEDCKNDCPVLALGDYVSRSGAYAGINGSYFCPASYPSCADKKNSFDTLAMNKNKKYLNSDNNVYSTVPAVIFLGGGVRFVGKSLEWGRDTGVDGVLANYPLLVSDNNTVASDQGDPKLASRGSRSFVGASGSTVYIGVVHNVTIGESAKVLKNLGLQHALNLDSGGSTALWAGGYKVGPGRGIPNAILFVRK